MASQVAAETRTRVTAICTRRPRMRRSIAAILARIRVGAEPGARQPSGQRTTNQAVRGPGRRSARRSESARHDNRRRPMPAPTTLQVNGRQATVAAEPDTPLLYILRNDLALNGAKFGCGLGQCGACTVLVDGQPARSCITELVAVAGRAVTTLEGLGTLDNLHKLQRAFIAEQAAQCGYC